MKKNEVARELYKNGSSVREIAQRLSVTERTVYRWKGLDDKKGISWERLKLEQSIDDQTFKQKQRSFLVSMFNAFERDAPRLDDIEPDERLAILDKYTNLYYKLMNAAKRAEPEVAMTEIITRTVQVIADLAVEKGQTEFVQFLLEELEEIKMRIADK
ncbi:DUF1804 family protein [Desulfovulcanus sp.]